MYEVRSKILSSFIQEIKTVNRNPCNNLEILELIKDKTTNPEIKLYKGTCVYRSRIISDISAWEEEEKAPGFYGYNKPGCSAPPPNMTKDMRANYRNIPYLYCANHAYLALVEVRPRLGALISVATIEVLDDTLDYIPTQYIAEYAKNRGYDGIAYSSSLTPEIYEKHPERYNVVIFDEKKYEPIKSNLVRVGVMDIRCEQKDEDVEKLQIESSDEENWEEVACLLGVGGEA